MSAKRYEELCHAVNRVALGLEQPINPHAQHALREIQDAIDWQFKIKEQLEWVYELLDEDDLRAPAARRLVRRMILRIARGES